jgi:opacity protein-like surface antigen
MNKILKLSAIALLASSTSLMAQSKNFAGASLGISVSAVGAEISGSSTSSSGGTAGQNSTSGSIGKVAEIAAIDASYGFAMGANSVFVVGATYTPGKAKAGTGNYTDNNTEAQAGVASNTGTLSVEVKDPYTIYVAPTYVVGNNAALYAKLGYSKADINVNATGGAALTTKPSDLEGWTYAIGSKTLLTNNVYVGVEASVTDYDKISAVRATNVSTSADVKVAQGTITLGYKF